MLWLGLDDGRLLGRSGVGREVVRVSEYGVAAFRLRGFDRRVTQAENEDMSQYYIDKMLHSQKREGS